MSIHTLWFKFAKKFIQGDNYMALPHENRWKYLGYELMERVEKFAKTNRSIRISRCDDSCYASSFLVMIPHRNRRRKKKSEQYHGTTVVVIPQCDGQYPTIFFLYPNHKAELNKALKDMK